VSSHLAREPAEPRRSVPALHLLGCQRVDDRLLVEFVVRQGVAVTIEAPVVGSPYSWGAFVTDTVRWPRA